MPPPPVSRRIFLNELATLGAALAVVPHLRAAERPPAREFRSEWATMPDRIWTGPEYWANPLQDWRVAGGRAECHHPGGGRTLHVLTRDLHDGDGTLRLHVRLGRVAGGPITAGRGSAGFAVGVQGPLRDYRHNLIFGSGLAAGLRANGELFLGLGNERAASTLSLGDVSEVELHLAADPQGGGYRLRLEARDAARGTVLGEVARDGVPGSALTGNLALGANLGAPNQPPAETDAWWFADWRISGTKVAAHEDRAFGPLWFNQYTLHEGTLKMNVQLPPLGPQDDQVVRLEVPRGTNWRVVGEARIDPAARNALFRIPNWDSGQDQPYRVTYRLRDAQGAGRDHHLHGTVRQDPGERPILSVADLSCNAHYAFPNTHAAAALAKLNPDLLAFTGDQYYESTGGYGVDRSGGDRSALDVLRKWAMHGWTWRELMRDRPSVSIPDDHDVYHGNLWGEGGGAAPGNDGRAESIGGYKMTADFVNTVHRMQTAHHPDSPAMPGRQGITGYYGPLTYGRVSFAILADRQYKSAPDGKVPPTTSGRADHVVDPQFDPRSADLPGLELLGQPQLQFLRQWTQDWRGADMKAVISQTIFTAMATHHGKTSGHLVADYDTNAWPQAARNAAVREMRRAFAFHLAGDQHLPAVVHYGIDAHRDAGVAFASPAVNNLYPRWFRPEGSAQPTGDFRDSFGHPLTVLACANPRETFRRPVLEAETDKSAGIGLVRFDKRARKVIIECWPLLADPTQPKAQFPGWPLEVSQFDNYARQPVAHLPIVRVEGAERPVLDVIDEATGELVYTLRLPSTPWRPPVFSAGAHTVQIRIPETHTVRVVRGLQPQTGALPDLVVTL